MPNTREKLIEILEAARDEAMETCGSMNHGFGAWYADRLIANGVTIADDVSAVAYNLSPTEQKWIPVSERLPEKDVKVLTFGVYGFSVNYRDRFSGKWRGVNGKPQWITHWMPLPEPPKGE